MLSIVLMIVGIILLFLFCACIVSSRCSRMEEKMKNKNFIVIENNYEMIFEDKKLAIDYYLDLCDWCEGAERNRYFETYSNIKHSKCNILTDGSEVKESRKYTYKMFREEKEIEQKIIDEMGV